MFDRRNIKYTYLKLSKKIKDFLLSDKSREFLIFLFFSSNFHTEMVVPISIYSFTRKMHNFYFSIPFFFYKTAISSIFFLKKSSRFLCEIRHFFKIVYCFGRKKSVTAFILLHFLLFIILLYISILYVRSFKIDISVLILLCDQTVL